MAKTLRTGWVIVQMLCRVEEYETVVAPRCQAEELSESSTLRKLIGLPVSERGVRQTNSRKGGRGASKAASKPASKKLARKTVEGEENSELSFDNLLPKASAPTITETPEGFASSATRWEATGEPWNGNEQSVKPLPLGALLESMFDPDIDYEGGADDDEDEAEVATKSPKPDGENILNL